MYVHIIIKEHSLKESMKFVLNNPQIIDNATNISIEKYWKEPGYYSVKFEIRNYKALVYDNIIRSLPKNFGRLGICKYNESLDITGTSSLYQADESKVKCGDITFIDISEIEIALLDRLPDEDIITI